MAEVASAFFSGIAAGQAQQAHRQALADSRLRQEILKHQLSRARLEDKLRQRDLLQKFADLQLGQDDLSDGAEGVAEFTPSTRLRSRSYAGAQSLPDVIGGLIRERMGGFQPTPTQMAAPAAQTFAVPEPNALDRPRSLMDVVNTLTRQRFDGQRSNVAAAAPRDRRALGRYVLPIDSGSDLPPLNLHDGEAIPAGYQEAGDSASVEQFGDERHDGMRGNGHVWLPAISIPELDINIPGQWFSARAARVEQTLRARAAERAKAFTLGPGQARYLGNEEIARGPERAKTQTDLALEAAGGSPAGAMGYLHPPRQVVTPPSRLEDVLLDGQLAKVFVDPRTKAMSDLAGNTIDNPDVRVRPVPRAAPRTADPTVVAKREYDEFVKVYDRQHPPLTATERATALSDDEQNRATLADQTTPQQTREYVQRQLAASPLRGYVPPPSFDKWRVMTTAERQAVLSNPGQRITDEEMIRRRAAETSPSGVVAQPANRLQVADPKSGKVYHFPNEEAADAFRREIGARVRREIGAGSASGVPPAVAAALKGKAVNRRYTLSDGTIWDVLPDGNIRQSGGARGSR